MSFIRLAYVILPLLFTGPASYAAERETSVRQEWCGDDTFRVVIDEPGIGLPADAERCFALTSSTFTTAARPRSSRLVFSPVGNSIDYVLREAMGQSTLTHRDVPTPKARAFEIKSGRCGSHDIFVVETVAHAEFPSLLTDGAQVTARQCEFNAGTRVRVTSEFDLAGIYGRSAATSVEHFVRTLMRR